MGLEARLSKFYIFGLQRSGTTFVENLITLNFNARVCNREGSWKHSLSIPNKLHDDLSIVVFKNPYTWLESIVFRDPADLLVTAKSYKLTEHSNDSYVIGHDRVDLVQLSKLYNDYVSKWSETSFIKVRYEDLLEKDKLDEFLSSVPFDKRHDGDWIIPEPGSLFMSEGFSSNMYTYYIEKKPKYFTEDDLRVINTNIDHQVLHRIGYSISS
jgi:hypothetical protein